MRKMLIVDDNNKDRRVLRELINWGSFGVELLGEAVNGQEALQKVAESPPDILITDIFMPVMNGIELVSEVRKSYPEIKIIFMSFSEDFEFAKSAIDLSVYGYIVKPIRGPEVEATIRKVLSIYHKEEKSETEKRELLARLDKAMPVLRESFLRDLLFGVYRGERDIAERIEFFGLPRFANGSAQVYSILVKTEAGLSVAEQYSAAYAIRELLSVREEGQSVFVLQTAPGEYAVLHISGEPPADELSYILELYPRLDAILPGDFVVGISLASPRLNEIHTLFRQAKKAAAATFYSRQIPVVSYREIAGPDSPAKHIYADELYGRIDELLTDMDEQAVRAFLQEQFPAGGAADGQYLRYRAFSIVNVLQILTLERGRDFQKLVGDDSVLWKKLNAIRAVPELIQWLESILLRVKESFFAYSQSRNGQIAEHIKRIVRERYAEQLSVDDIAREVYLSAKQANNIFRRETGQSVFEYLVSYRIRVARELLLKPDARISEVAYQVGYANTSHFGILFKKLTGKTPREFRFPHETRGNAE